MLILRDNPQDYRVLFLDMDAFFASCEQQLNPSLRKRPIGVVPEILTTTCILSPSYEAKRLGVRTGTSVREALLRCPNIQLVAARPKIYKQIHYHIRDIISNVTPWFHAGSIDEFAVHISPSEREKEKVEKIALYIKDAFRTSLGDYITASIGFGPNRFLAKVASELHKPNAVEYITLANREQVLCSLELTDLPGIAFGMSRQLRGMGIYTIKQLLATSAQTLRLQFGFPGEVWWYRLHGYEVDDVSHQRSTIGHSHVLAPAWRTPHKAYQVLQRLVHKAGQRLRKEGFQACDTALIVRYIGRESYYNHIHTGAYSDSTTATQLADYLYTKRPLAFEPILQLAFSFSKLVRYPGRPMRLFPEIERTESLTDALDAINDKFGRDTIYRASMLNARHTAPDRIPFGELRY